MSPPSAGAKANTSSFSTLAGFTHDTSWNISLNDTGALVSEGAQSQEFMATVNKQACSSIVAQYSLKQIKGTQDNKNARNPSGNHILRYVYNSYM